MRVCLRTNKTRAYTLLISYTHSGFAYCPSLTIPSLNFSSQLAPFLYRKAGQKNHTVLCRAATELAALGESGLDP